MMIISSKALRTRFVSTKTISFFIFLLGAAALSSSAFSQAPTAPGMGSNVIVFDPSMSVAQIKAVVDPIAAQQIGNQFGTRRYTLLFMPGTYGSSAQPLNFQVGYYTEVAGLGASPNDVVINGSVYVRNQCGSSGCVALSNFWRSLSNLTINVTTPKFGCYSGEFWAVSQAAPWRRVQVNGNTTFMDYCTGPSYASGGFIADSVTRNVVNGSQQQFFVRNSTIGKWSNAVWNQVFAGVQGSPAQSYPNPTYTVLPTVSVSREKPFLFVDADGNYNVFAPALRTNTTGTSWGGSSPASGRTLPLSSFFVADPSTSVQRINAQLASGKNLILTPGVYSLDRSIEVKRPDAVVLGLGFATLVPQNGTSAITVADVDGVQVSGMIVDAGPANSSVLFQIGKPHGAKPSAADDPVTLNDVFFRIGGATAGSATTSLQVDHDNVILDDVWAWRADHGAGVGWTINTADHGVVVNGDNVTATGLFVEHYQKEQVLWNGNGGETIFYQSELPYDVPSQSAWMDGTANGYPSYVVSDGVTTHHTYGFGIYSFFNRGIYIIEDAAMTVPVASGVAVHDAGTVLLNGKGEITHVVNDTGSAATKPGALNPVTAYP